MSGVETVTVYKRRTSKRSSEELPVVIGVDLDSGDIIKLIKRKRRDRKLACSKPYEDRIKMLEKRGFVKGSDGLYHKEIIISNPPDAWV